MATAAFSVPGSNLTYAQPLESTSIGSEQPSTANAGNVGRIFGSVLGCVVFLGVIVSIGIIVARYYQKRRLMRNDTFTFKNVTVPDDGVDNEAYTTVEDTDDRPPVTSAPTFCSASKRSTDKKETIENLQRDGGPVYENTSKETLLEAKETIYEDIVKTESEAGESDREIQQFFSEEAVSISDSTYLSMEPNFHDGSSSGSEPDSEEDLYLQPIPDRHSLDTMAGGHDECSPNPV